MNISNLVLGGRLLGYPSLYEHPNIEYIMDLDKTTFSMKDISKIRFVRIW